MSCIFTVLAWCQANPFFKCRAKAALGIETNFKSNIFYRGFRGGQHEFSSSNPGVEQVLVRCKTSLFGKESRKMIKA